MSIERVVLAEPRREFHSDDIDYLVKALGAQGVECALLPDLESELCVASKPTKNRAVALAEGFDEDVYGLLSAVKTQGDMVKTYKEIARSDALIIPNLDLEGRSRKSMVRSRHTLGAVVQAGIAQQTGVPVFLAGDEPSIVRGKGRGPTIDERWIIKLGSLLYERLVPLRGDMGRLLEVSV